MKKISILALHLGYGGIEKCIANLANLIASDYQVEIISTYKIQDQPAFEISDKVKIKYLIENYKPNRDAWKYALKKLKLITLLKETYYALVVLFLRRKKTVEAIKNCNSDIIISTRDLFNKWLGNYANKKVYKIGWEHNHHHQDVNYIKKLVNSCKDLDTLVLVSDSLRSFYKKEMKQAGYKCKCVYIPNMLDSIPDKSSTLTEKRLISVGRFYREKGFPDLIEMFRQLQEKEPEWKLDIVGDGTEKNKIVDLIYQYDLVDSVTVHGFLKRKEIDKLLNKSSIYVMTSYTESFGIVLIEAMSHGVPCIAYKSAEGANDLIQNGKNGYLISNRDPEEMVNRIIELIHDKKKRQELGANAKELSQNYTTDKIKKNWVQLLKKKG